MKASSGEIKIPTVGQGLYGLFQAEACSLGFGSCIGKLFAVLEGNL